LSCRSDARRDCYVRAEWQCVASLADIALTKDPDCCRCLRDRGSAELNLALTSLETNSPADTARNLMTAVDLLDRAVACSGGRSFNTDLDVMRRTYREFVDDRYEPLWASIMNVENPDRRLRAALAHARHFRGRCTHDVAAIVRRYVAAASVRPLPELREELLDLADTPVAGELLDVYSRRRLEGIGSDLLPLRTLRNELKGTSYERATDAIVDSHLATVLAAAPDAISAESVCGDFSTASSREQCRRRAEELWVEQIDAASGIEDLREICVRSSPVETRRRCQAKLAVTALEAAKREPTIDNLEIAKAFASRDPSTRHEWRLFTFRRSADESFDAVQAGFTETGLRVPPSVQTLKKFSEQFDAMVVELFPGERSLRGVHPELAGKVDRQLAGLTKSVNRDLREAEIACRRHAHDRSSSDIDALDDCISSAVEILRRDYANERATRLLSGLQKQRQKILGPQPKWELADVAIPLALSETIRAIVPQTFARLAAKLLVFGARTH
jgi:hypothetical protein